MTFTFVNAAGQPVNINELAKKHKRPPKAAAEGLRRVETRSEAKRSDGFVVTGYSPEDWSDRAVTYDHELKRFQDAGLGAKNPGTLDEFTAKWMQENKPKRARSKPYEVEAAADQCAEMMRKAGWLHVTVSELLKG
jgi:hypothetical protein